MNARTLAWMLAWGIPSASLILGIVLTVMAQVDVWAEFGAHTYEASRIVVWPAGVALLATGVLGLTAVSLATALTVRPDRSR
ncbi:hypothetical protein QFZ53_001482 [Microbacterium natoriense]|uniref:Uncharacterized protein n=1 Tax=Microbacterium natoriense TaxID=284570 RepID=A0AAW8EVC9_9MICO|nr:hypothetical protein [Microbacterium natoriense]